MADLICVDLSNKPVQRHLGDWLTAAKQLRAVGQFQRAQLLLDTILQAEENSIEALKLLVRIHLQLGGDKHVHKALQLARRSVAVSKNSSAEDEAQCNLALGLSLGSVARMTVISQADRSSHRSEARTVLHTAAQLTDSYRVPSLYALAVIDAEGGHYDQAVQHAQEALEAAEAAEQQGTTEGNTASIVSLLALLLSARQQLQGALSVCQAGLDNMSSKDQTDSVLNRSSQSGLPRCHDILLMRVKAQLLLASADVNGALAVLGAAKQRLSIAKQQLTEQHAAAAAMAVLKKQEAQVWRDLALAYGSQQQASDAQLCAQQMQQLEPHSAATYHALGAVAAASGDPAGAKQAYTAALALDAAYAPALLSLGALLRETGDVHDLSVAAGLLTDALRYEPHNHVGWYNLGMARKAQGHMEEGNRHLFTAVTLSAAAPVLSYSELPLCI